MTLITYIAVYCIYGKAACVASGNKNPWRTLLRSYRARSPNAPREGEKWWGVRCVGQRFDKVKKYGLVKLLLFTDLNISAYKDDILDFMNHYVFQRLTGQT